MATVRSLSFAGKSVNVPHTEHRDPLEKNVVTFDADGVAEVSEILAESLVEFYPRDVEVVEPRAFPEEVTEEE